MDINQMYSELLLRIQGLEGLFNQVDTHVIESFTFLWGVIAVVFTIIGVALYFLAQQLAAKGVQDKSKEIDIKMVDYEKRIATLEIELRKAQPKIESMTKTVVGSYTGTGTYGDMNPNQLTFDFVPKMILVSKNHSIHENTIFFNPSIYGVCFEHSERSTSPVTVYSVRVIWSGNDISWYSSENAIRQLNETGVRYHYIAIG